MTTIREAEAQVRKMRRWKKRAGAGHRQDAAHALKAAVTKALIAAAVQRALAASRKGR